MQIEILPDVSGNLRIGDVSRPPLSHQFVPFDNRKAAALRVPSDVYWWRLRIKVPPQTPAVDLIATYRDAELYLPLRGNRFSTMRFGLNDPVASRASESGFPYVALPKTTLNGEPLYLRARTLGGPPDTPQLARDSVWQRIRSFQLALGLFFGGFLAAIALSSLFFAIFLRDRTYLLNSATLTAAILWLSAITGFGPQFLWPNAGVNFLALFYTFYIAYQTFILLFIRDFLHLSERFPAADRALAGGFSLGIAYTCMLAIFPHSPLAFYYAQPLAAPLQVVPEWAVALGVSLFAWRNGVREARFFTIGLAALMVFFTWNMLVYFRVVPPTVLGSLGVHLGIVIDAAAFQLALADRYLIQIREKARAQADLLAERQMTIARLQTYNRAVDRFVPHEFLDELGHTDVTAVQLGDHVQCTMTVLFIDIRGFTTIAEVLEPQAIFHFLNEYLARIGPIVRDHRGFIDKYIGDAVMALFPGCADNALQAAIALAKEVRAFNECRPDGPPIEVGISLHRGALMLGTIGEARRLETTVIADEVNIASRLEGLTKIYRAKILLTDSVRDAVKEVDRYHLRPLGSVQVKGAVRPVNLYELYDGDMPELLEKKARTSSEFATAVQLYTSGRLVDASERFAALCNDGPHDATAAYLYERCITMLRTGSALDWDGIERIDVKR